MEVKLFEVRDRATFIPCFAIRMKPSDDAPFRVPTEQRNAEVFLLRRAGFDWLNPDYDPHVIFGRLEAGECQYDPFAWGSMSRTMQAAHRFIQAHWAELRSGDVVDVEFILNETAQPKVSERTP